VKAEVALYRLHKSFQPGYPTADRRANHRIFCAELPLPMSEAYRGTNLSRRVSPDFFTPAESESSLYHNFSVAAKALEDIGMYRPGNSAFSAVYRA
jgi:hypothetical protein